MRNYLYEVVPIRLFLIVTLVFYHAFAIHSGAWESINSNQEIPIYAILDKLSYACLLETFVFISGYILGNKVSKKHILSAQNVFLKKAKRLIIPSILFSFLYILLLGDDTQPLLKILYRIINGAGHMWFLPMLYWCFVEIYILEKINIDIKYKVFLLFLLMPFSILSIPFRLGSSLYYLFFFYLGYCIKKYDYNLKLNKHQILFVFVCFCLFLFVFLL